MAEYKDKTKEQLVNEMKKMRERIFEYEESIVDELTCVHNIRRFLLLARHEYERALRYERALSFIMMRPDNFKQLKKNHEDKIIDQILVTVAERCRTNLRYVDILGRYGGEEFVFLLPEAELPASNQIAERIRRCIAGTPVSTEIGSIKITSSLGVANLTKETPNMSSLLERAEKAMQHAKQGGRNRVEVV